MLKALYEGFLEGNCLMGLLGNDGRGFCCDGTDILERFCTVRYMRSNSNRNNC